MSCVKMNAFLSKRMKIEDSIGIFICPDCRLYSTNSDTEFVQHMDQCHSTMTTIQCIYCNKMVNKLFIIQHTRFHYRNDVTSKLTCRLCSESISIISLDDIFYHIKNCHRSSRGCINCEKTFDTDIHLINHIKHNFSRLFHCNISNCKVKLDKYNEVIDHMKSQNHRHFSLENVIMCDPMKYDVIPKLIVKDDCITKQYNSLDLRSSETKQLTDKFIRRIIVPEKVAKFQSSVIRCKVEQEVYELVFMKEDFLQMNSSRRIDNDLMIKLSSVGKYKMSKPIKKNEKIYYCMTCKYTSHHAFNDVKKHILSQHCYIHHTDIRNNMTFISHQFLKRLFPCNLSSSSAATTSKVPIEPIASSSDANGIKSVKATPDNELNPYRIINIPFSRRVFEFVYNNESDMVKQKLLQKLTQLETCRIKVDMNVLPKLFICGHCNFESKHSIVDVKRHIMRRHCNVVSELLQDFCKLTKVDTQWELLSDEAILDMFDSQNEVNSKHDAIMKMQAEQQKASDDREILALKNIRDRKRKTTFDS